MRRVRSLLYCVVAALGVLGWASSANAQAQRVGVCVESVNPTTGANQCNDGWATVLLNGMKANAVAVKTTAGALGKIYCFNPSAATAYFQVYNASVSATETALLAGTQAPQQSYGIETTTGQSIVIPTPGDWFGTAITVSAATTATGNTAPATAIDCNASYE